MQLFETLKESEREKAKDLQILYNIIEIFSETVIEKHSFVPHTSCVRG